MTEAFIELMRRLGCGRYGAPGGDWGALVTTNIGLLDPQHVAGIHLNMPLAVWATRARSATKRRPTSRP
jgi:pimeloyl-ACP methyl ester carboxylesterase